MALPPIAPTADLTAEEKGESPSVEKGEQHEIKCAARDCKYNTAGECTTDISVSSGPNVKCLTYEPGGKGPLPPMPMMGKPPMGGMLGM